MWEAALFVIAALALGVLVLSLAFLVGAAIGSYQSRKLAPPRTKRAGDAHPFTGRRD